MKCLTSHKKFNYSIRKQISGNNDDIIFFKIIYTLIYIYQQKQMNPRIQKHGSQKMMSFFLKTISWLLVKSCKNATCIYFTNFKHEMHDGSYISLPD